MYIKYLLFCLCFSIASQCTYAQVSPEELTKAEQKLLETQTLYSKEHIEYAKVAFDLALLYYQKEDNEEEGQLLATEALRFIRKENGSKSALYLESLAKLNPQQALLIDANLAIETIQAAGNKRSAPFVLALLQRSKAFLLTNNTDDAYYDGFDAYVILGLLPKEESIPIYDAIPNYLSPPFISFIKKQLQAKKALLTIPNTVELADILTAFSEEIIGSEINYLKQINIDTAYMYLKEALSIYEAKLGNTHPKYQKALETFTPEMKTFYSIEKDINGRINRHETSNDVFVTDLRVYLKMADNANFIYYDSDYVFKKVLVELEEHHGGTKGKYYIIVKAIKDTWDLTDEEQKIAIQKSITEQIKAEFGASEQYLEALINLANLEADDGESSKALKHYNEAFDLIDNPDLETLFDTNNNQTLFEKYIQKVISPWKIFIIQERNLKVVKSVYSENSNQYLNAMFQAAWYYLEDYDFGDEGEELLFKGIARLNESNFQIAKPWLDSLFLDDAVGTSYILIPHLPKTYPLVHLKELLKGPMDSIAKEFTTFSLEYNNASELLADGYFYSKSDPNHPSEALLFYKKILNKYNNIEGKSYEYETLLTRLIDNIEAYNPWAPEEASFFFEEELKVLKKDQGIGGNYLKYLKKYADWHYKNERLISSESHYRLFINYYDNKSEKEKSSVEYIDASYKLARIYRKTGRYNKAILLYYKTVTAAIQVREFVYIARCLDDIGLAAYEKERPEIAMESFDGAMNALNVAEMFDPSLNRYDNFDMALLYIKIQRHIGRIHLNNGYIELAETFYDDIIEFELDENTPVSFEKDISLQSDLAYLAALKGDTAEAIHYYEVAIEKTKDQAELAEVNLAFASFHQEYEKDSIAAIFFQDALEIDLNRIEKNYTNLAEKERLLFLKPISKRLNSFFNFALPKQDSVLALAAFNAHLTVKGLALETSTNLQSICNQTENTILKNKCYEMQALRKKLAKSTSLSTDEQSDIGLEIMDLEKEIGVTSKDLRAYFGKNNKKLDFYQLKQILKGVETKDSLAIAIDFLILDQIDDSGYESSVYYAAVIGSDFESPIFIPLATEEALEDVLAPDIAPNTINYITDELESRYLYELIWEPLLPHILDAKRLHICPGGILSKIAFGTLRTSDYDQRRIMDDWSIHYYSSLRDLLNPQVGSLDSETVNIGLVGGVKFTFTKEEIKNLATRKNIPELDLEEAFKEQAKVGSDLAESRGARGEDFSYLPGTLEEVNAISTIFPKDWVVNLLSDTLATEENLEIMTDNSPTILHIATHGYFFPTPEEEYEDDIWTNPQSSVSLEDKIAHLSNPLLRSGLALAGINRVWKGGPEIEGLDDGILTALEVANMDLFNTDLVVLSACETGRGDIDNNEGIMGLRRAFKTAGAKQLLISLWKVPDEQTSELMQLFYKEYINGKSAHQAFQDAQHTMRKRYRNPYYWAAFLLIE